MTVLLIICGLALAVCAFALAGVTAQRDEARHEAALLRAEFGCSPACSEGHTYSWPCELSPMPRDEG